VGTTFNVPGPAEIATGTEPTTGNMQFLGFSERGIRVREILYTGNIQSDYAGHDGMPAEVRLSGKGLILSTQLVRFDPGVMANVKARYFGGTEGAVGPNEIGSLLFTEGLSFQTMVRSRYAITHPVFFQQGQRPGLRAPVCLATGELDWDLTTNAQVFNLTIAAFCVIDVISLAGTLYDFDMTNFPAVTSALNTGL
jgi:hypothetical protein